MSRTHRPAWPACRAAADPPNLARTAAYVSPPYRIRTHAIVRSRFVPCHCSLLPCRTVDSRRRRLAVEANARRRGLRSITTDEVKQHVDVLADDTFEGREAGSRGNRAAGIYIVERLKKLGLPGGGTKGSYYQTVRQLPQHPGPGRGQRPGAQGRR